MSKNVLVIGSGGREHAMCWKLAQSPEVSCIEGRKLKIQINSIPAGVECIC